MGSILRIDPRSYFFWAILVLMVPVDWLCGAFVAAAAHECGHIVMIFLLKGKVNRIEVRPGGAVISTGTMDSWQELLCALAGPIGSFSLALLSRYLPRTAVCAVIQGMFNMLPIYPLDGGRAFRCCLELLRRKKPCKQRRFNVQ